ncbi:hypothetical protein C8Q70DRAFT_395635 [Cubamyces menziesii]|nr:hypothetical protein C8Q70DRAFT_395635 [Cubamyces menziesii]
MLLKAVPPHRIWPSGVFLNDVSHHLTQHRGAVHSLEYNTSPTRSGSTFTDGANMTSGATFRTTMIKRQDNYLTIPANHFCDPSNGRTARVSATLAASEPFPHRLLRLGDTRHVTHTANEVSVVGERCGDMAQIQKGQGAKHQTPTAHRRVDRMES